MLPSRWPYHWYIKKYNLPKMWRLENYKVHVNLNSSVTNCNTFNTKFSMVIQISLEGDALWCMNPICNAFHVMQSVFIQPRWVSVWIHYFRKVQMSTMIFDLTIISGKVCWMKCSMQAMLSTLVIQILKDINHLQNNSTLLYHIS